MGSITDKILICLRPLAFSSFVNCHFPELPHTGWTKAGDRQNTVSLSNFGKILRVVEGSTASQSHLIAENAIEWSTHELGG